MSGPAFLMGRRRAELSDQAFSGEDRLYAAQRLDGLVLQAGQFDHCTFANVSFLNARVRDTSFTDCTFLSCYFRGTTFTNVTFAACRFIDCEFPRVTLSGCTFRYGRFVRCFIDFEAMEHSLPSEPNLRQQLARTMSIAAARAGESAESRAYRLCELRARDSDWIAAIKGQTPWYRDHFDGYQRVGLAFRLAGSFLNRHLFGYGLSAWVLVRNLMIAAGILFPIIFYVLRSDLVSGTGAAADAWGALWFSLDVVTPVGIESGLHAGSALTRLVAGVEATAAVVWASLLAAYLYRWSLHR